jgi:hypothetical protein
MIICIICILVIILVSLLSIKIIEPFEIIEKIPKDANLIIVTSHYKEDLKWLEDTKIPVVVCSKVRHSPLCIQDKNIGSSSK